jgi:hypothetical protein
MTMKSMTLAVSVAFGLFLSACGGPEMNGQEGTTPPDVELVTSEQGICEGYAPGAVCTVRCTSSSAWFYIPGVAYGQCESAGAAYCGRSPSGACWSR